MTVLNKNSIMNKNYNEIVHYIYCKYDDVDKCLSPFCNEKTCQHVRFQCDVRRKKKKKTIHLVLKHKWFDMINRGEKKEEYRDITKRYEKILKDATHVVFHKGYTNVTCERRIVRIVKGCGNEEWGAEPEKEYFILIITKIK